MYFSIIYNIHRCVYILYIRALLGRRMVEDGCAANWKTTTGGWKRCKRRLRCVVGERWLAAGGEMDDGNAYNHI